MKKRIGVIILLVLSVGVFGRGIEYYESFFEKTPEKIEKEIKILKDSDEEKKNYKLGILYTTLSVNDPEKKKASKKAKKYLEKTMKKDKNNSLLNNYYAMALSLVGRDHWNPIVKMSSMKKSFKYFDKAVELATENKDNKLWYIRFSRSNVYTELPDFFNKSEEAKKDLEFLKDQYEYKGNISKAIMVTVYSKLGEFSRIGGNLDKAINYWEKALNISKEINLNNEEVQNVEKQLSIFKVE
ncbi:MAG: hypothetical protein ACQERZ_04675 [Fusobacteriota bacterium]